MTKTTSIILDERSAREVRRPTREHAASLKEADLRKLELVRDGLVQAEMAAQPAVPVNVPEMPQRDEPLALLPLILMGLAVILALAICSMSVWR